MAKVLVFTYLQAIFDNFSNLHLVYNVLRLVIRAEFSIFFPELLVNKQESFDVLCRAKSVV